LDAQDHGKVASARHANYALCVQEKRACILLMANSTRAEAIFVTLVQRLLGDVPIPASWEGCAPAR
jgi:hypothetical protein